MARSLPPIAIDPGCEVSTCFDDHVERMKFAASRSHMALSSTWPSRLQRAVLAPVDNQRPAALFGAPLAGCLQ